MARYDFYEAFSFIVDLEEFNNCYVFDNDVFNTREKNYVGLREHAIVTKENKGFVEFKNGYYYEISPYLNRYDAYDSILDVLIGKKKTDIEYLKACINDKYITFDMYITLFSNYIKFPLPTKYSRKDFNKLLDRSFNDREREEYINSLYEKYKDIIMEEQIKYIEEERRMLNKNRDRIVNLMEVYTKDLASLACQRNDIDENIKKLK